MCPRGCRAERGGEGRGFCRAPERAVISRAAPHFGEEPCISGTRGSGAVFFCGCNLRCVFCQNRDISRSMEKGKTLSDEELARIFAALEAQGVHNINLVTPSHYTGAIRRALRLGKPGVPVVYNSSGYDSVLALKSLSGLVNVYMPDMKYLDAKMAGEYSAAPDYPETAKRAIIEMYRQTGPFVLDEAGLMQSGVIIRHLIMPGNLDNTFDVIDWTAETFPRGSVMFSLMAQYTPMGSFPEHPELERGITQEEYDRAVSYLEYSGIETGFVQEMSSATSEMIPDFDLTGVDV